jgi:hypothetical protein
MNMQTLVNLLQEGSVGNKGGQLAVVCIDPNVADLALANGLLTQKVQVSLDWSRR